MFNHGAEIPDIEAAGTATETLSQWRKRAGIEPSRQIKIVKLSHMRYQHPDFNKITAFLQDFGMVVAKETEDEIWYRGYGNDQYVYYARQGPKEFLGGCFEVESYQDLEKASMIEGAGEIQELSNAPGGGFMVTLTDPECVALNLMFGQEPAEGGPEPEKLVINYEREKPRTRRFHRFQEGPAAVHKVCYTNFPYGKTSAIDQFVSRLTSPGSARPLRSLRPRL